MIADVIYCKWWEVLPCRSDYWPTGTVPVRLKTPNAACSAFLLTHTAVAWTLASVHWLWAGGSALSWLLHSARSIHPPSCHQQNTFTAWHRCMVGLTPFFSIPAVKGDKLMCSPNKSLLTEEWNVWNWTRFPYRFTLNKVVIFQHTSCCWFLRQCFRTMRKEKHLSLRV